MALLSSLNVFGQLLSCLWSRQDTRRCSSWIEQLPCSNKAAFVIKAAVKGTTKHFPVVQLTGFLKPVNLTLFLQQFRFAVAETVPKDKIPRSLSILMLAGIVAALLGPEVGQRYSAVDGLPLYVGSFFGLAGLLTISLLILVMFYRDTNVVTEVSEGEIRPAQVIFKQPKLILAIVSAAMAYSIMSLVMTATPLSMHEIERYTLESTTRVLQSHILAMYAPSFFSGFLISKLGVFRVIKFGLAVMTLSIFVGSGDPGYADYWVALIFLGIVES